MPNPRARRSAPSRPTPPVDDRDEKRKKRKPTAASARPDRDAPTVDAETPAADRPRRAVTPRPAKSERRAGTAPKKRAEQRSDLQTDSRSSLKSARPSSTRRDEARGAKPAAKPRRAAGGDRASRAITGRTVSGTAPRPRPETDAERPRKPGSRTSRQTATRVGEAFDRAERTPSDRTPTRRPTRTDDGDTRPRSARPSSADDGNARPRSARPSTDGGDTRPRSARPSSAATTRPAAKRPTDRAERTESRPAAAKRPSGRVDPSGERTGERLGAPARVVEQRTEKREAGRREEGQVKSTGGRVDLRADKSRTAIEADGPIRLNKFLALIGVASRRTADELISSGRLSVNGETVRDLGTKVNAGRDRVALDGRLLSNEREKRTYVLLNKPKDTITTSSDEKGRKTVLDLVPSGERLYPVGRLDRHTTGLLLLTNDGDLAHRLMHPSFGVEKTYLVTTKTPVSKLDLDKLTRGIELDDGMTAPATVALVAGARSTSVEITIHEGRHHQVRRMFEALGHDVEKLDRIVYAGLTLSGVRRSEYRSLTRDEVVALRRRVKLDR